jgi:hypothetical protein
MAAKPVEANTALRLHVAHQSQENNKVPAMLSKVTLRFEPARAFTRACAGGIICHIYATAVRRV